MPCLSDHHKFLVLVIPTDKFPDALDKRGARIIAKDAARFGDVGKGSGHIAGLLREPGENGLLT